MDVKSVHNQEFIRGVFSHTYTGVSVDPHDEHLSDKI